MSAGSGRWAAEPTGGPDVVEEMRRAIATPSPATGEEKRGPVDLDRLQEVAWALVGAALYLLGVIAAAVTLTMAFAGWVGALVVLVAGAVPAGYSLAKAHQRSAAREAAARQAEFRGGSLAAPSVSIPTRL